MPANRDSTTGTSSSTGRAVRGKRRTAITAGDGGQLDYLAIARIVAPHSVHGEVRAEILSDFPERFGGVKRIYVGPGYQPYEVEAVRLHRNQVRLKLLGVDTVEQAEALREKLVFVPTSEAVALKEGQYYWHQIIGLEVETSDGQKLGRISDILRTGSNDVYIAQDGRREILIPAIEDVIKEIDLERRRMLIEPLPGMLD